MKKIKAGIAVLLLLLAISCTKTSNNTSSNASVFTESDSTNATQSFSLGQSYHGGIIFYIDGTGQHGLIAATADQGTDIPWKKHGPYIRTGATGTKVGTGASNTAAIIAALGDKGTYAARLCSKYKAGMYKDWYLPSIDELKLLYAQKAVVGNFSATYYWSSSEGNIARALMLHFSDGAEYTENKADTLNVRAISSF